MATDVKGHTVPASTDHPKRSDLTSALLSVRDVVVVANAAGRATLITNLTSAGVGPSTSNPVIVFRTDARPDSALEMTTDGTTWRSVPMGGGLTNYTPTLGATTTAPNIGSSGTAAGRYMQTGQWVVGVANVIWGGTGITAGSGAYLLPAPVATDTGAITSGEAAGSGYFFDASTGNYYPCALVWSTTTAWRVLVLSSVGLMTGANPVAPAAGDRINVNFSYPAA